MPIILSSMMTSQFPNHIFAPHHLLRRIEVRPALQSERQRWGKLMAAHHYLGYQKACGEQVHYVATIDGTWVALLVWTSAALKLKPRDLWIGWDAIAKTRRLKLIANNMRFLVLPEWQVPNLASRVLALNMKRLSQDWQTFYGHPILLAETFVDADRFRGSCYKATGFCEIGHTRGFTRSRTGYLANGRPKKILVKQLSVSALKDLTNPYYVDSTNDKETVLNLDIERLPVDGKGGLIECLRTIIDPRKRRGRRHSMVALLAIAVCAMLSGAKSFAAIADWATHLTPADLKKFRNRRTTPPSEPTLRRILKTMDAQEFDNAINVWLASQAEVQGKAIAVDGKVLCGSHAGGKAAIQLLSALLHEEGIVIAQRSIDAKTNEIPELKNLLGPLNIEGCVITVDALHTQADTAAFIVNEKNADYLFTVKENQPNLYAALQGLDYETVSP